tara:strand:+ start:5068 stop:6465 length:1398 start_codon:yes stop_codon:yes gene_type:complete
MTLKVIILAGGSGSRLWPLSRSKYPKQFLSLVSQETMLQASIDRLSMLNIDSITIICNEDHRFFVLEQIKKYKEYEISIILESMGRSTAPAIAVASLIEENNLPTLVLAADHFVDNIELFTESVNKAIELSKDNKLVTFGIKPKSPHTGYGYIKKGSGSEGSFAIEKFVEKPDPELAKQLYSSNEYLWNSGMFLFKSKVYLDELAKFRPKIYEACTKATKLIEKDLDFLRFDYNEFERCPSESIDYAVMENTTQGYVVEMKSNWNDIGSWTSLLEISQKDENNNFSSGDAISIECKNSYIRSDYKLITAIGLEDMYVINSKDATLVAHKDKVEDIKLIINHLKNNGREEVDYNREVFRPWGSYDSLESGENFQVKILKVKPGAKLSIQSHNFRSEHWVVVSGTAEVTKGDETFILSENESTYIPVKTVHALKNPGEDELRIIEVQSGSYLGEDDIIRYEDIYGRK